MYLKLIITPYILRNTPPRLVKISDVPLDNNPRTTALSMDGTEAVYRKPPLSLNKYRKAAELVTLDIIYKKTLCLDITPERLLHTSDDQLLFFWCERAHLYLVKPAYDYRAIESTTIERSFQVHVQDEDGSTMQNNVHLPNLDDLEDGEWAAFVDTEGHSQKERMKAEFIAIATYRASPGMVPGEKKRKKVVALMLVRRQDGGIAYRVAMLDAVSMQKWLKCKRERILVALG